MSHIYIAGPLYGSGHQDDNIRTVLEVAELVAEQGHTPFVPHLYFFWNLISRNPRDFWLKLDKEWLRKCDGMIRIRGESPGSALEEGWSDDFGIPWVEIYYDAKSQYAREDISVKSRARSMLPTTPAVPPVACMSPPPLARARLRNTSMCRDSSITWASKTLRGS